MGTRGQFCCIDKKKLLHWKKHLTSLCKSNTLSSHYACAFAPSTFKKPSNKHEFLKITKITECLIHTIDTIFRMEEGRGGETLNPTLS